MLWLLCALVLSPAVLFLTRRHVRDDPPAVTVVRVQADWTMDDLLRALERLGLRVVPVNRSGGLEDGVLLTTTGRSWEELSALHKAAVPGEEALARWRGTVYVRPTRTPPDTQPLSRGKRSTLHAGPFYFYGDPDLLDQVEGLLSEQRTVLGFP
jgi:hypothetical protein